jgi:acetyl-CoA carboxylase carboxyl transferase subunit alpha
MEQKIVELKALAASTQFDLNGEIVALEGRLRKKMREVYSRLSALDRVNVARHPDRPMATDYVRLMLDEFVELSGDRLFQDDKAIVTGLARMAGIRFLLVAHRKGRDTRERLECNFGCAHPEGYRKALAKMRLAEKLHLPIVTLINTPGAYPGIGAEERGQARAIAVNIMEMFRLRVPVVCVVIGEGGSGGALGIGVGDRILVLEHAYYSVISPEGCAAILWKDGEKVGDAAEALKLTSEHLLELGVVDEVIPEPLGGAHRDPAKTVATVRETVLRHLEELLQVPPPELLERRQARFRALGNPLEGPIPDGS